MESLLLRVLDSCTSSYVDGLEYVRIYKITLGRALCRIGVQA